MGARGRRRVDVLSRTGAGVPSGDTDASWRESYSAVRKDLLRSNDATNLRRLERLGLGGTLERVLDLGAGDGNLRAALHAAGAREVVGMEPQPELAAVAATAGPVVIGRGEALPFAPESFDAVVSMDVLHHVPAEGLEPALREVHRVLRPGGRFVVSEPANTLTRRVLQALLDSPIASLTSFSRHKRTMVQLEWDTLGPWLEDEQLFPGRLGRAGFEVAEPDRHLLRVDVVATRPTTGTSGSVARGR